MELIVLVQSWRSQKQYRSIHSIQFAVQVGLQYRSLYGSTGQWRTVVTILGQVIYRRQFGGRGVWFSYSPILQTDFWLTFKFGAVAITGSPSETCDGSGGVAKRPKDLSFVHGFPEKPMASRVDPSVEHVASSGGLEVRVALRAISRQLSIFPLHLRQW